MKKLIVMFALVVALFNINTSVEAAHGEDQWDCYNRIVFNHPWIFKEGGNQIDDMHRLIKNDVVEQCDVDTEHIMFVFNTPNGNRYRGEILEGHAMILYDLDNRGAIAGTLIRLG